MTGIAFPSKGVGSPATQTVWFGAVPDRLNMAVPLNATNNNTSIAPAHYGNLWFPVRGSFTTFTTAPDGTTGSAQLFAEDTSNNTHFIQAGSLPSDGPNTGALAPGYALGPIRMAGYFKNGGRRIGAKVQAFGGGGGNSGILTVVFDLVGGQIGVPASATQFGSAILQPAGTQIIPAADGFYLCIQDFYFKDGGFALLVANWFLDQGTGTGPLNNTYTGTGLGVYCWRTSMMPVASYAIGGNVFLDDFLSTSTIDLANTKAPGFNWYPSAGKWTNALADSGSPYASSFFSVSSSVLTIATPGNPNGVGIMLGTATQISDVGGTYVGQAFGGGKPMLLEGKMSFSYATQELTQFNICTWWCNSLEWVVAQGQGQAAALASQPKFPGREFDLTQGSGASGGSWAPSTDALVYIGVSGAFGLPGNGAVKSLSQNFTPVAGFPPWESTWDYGGTYYPGRSLYVISGGNAYQPTVQTHNINNVPPNATFWNPVTPNQAAIASDPGQMHVYSHLILPYSQAGISGGMAQQQTSQTGGPVSGAVQDAGLGVKMSFFDGLWCNTAGFWGPNITFNFPSGDPASYIWLADAGHMTMYLSSGQSQTFNVDYIKVMQ